MKGDRKLKQLQTEYRTLKITERRLRGGDSSELMDVRLRILELKAQIKEAKSSVSKKIELTEHAICRYFERVLGYDFADIMEEILTPEVLEWIEELGPNGKYPIPNSEFRIVLKNNRIVTIEPI